MKVVAQFTIIPIGIGTSLSTHVAQAVEMIRHSGLKIEEHCMGTNIEGEWDQVMSLVKKIHSHLLKAGVPRLASSLKISIRQDKTQTIEQKNESLNQKILPNT